MAGIIRRKMILMFFLMNEPLARRGLYPRLHVHVHFICQGKYERLRAEVQPPPSYPEKLRCARRRLYPLARRGLYPRLPDHVHFICQEEYERLRAEVQPPPSYPEKLRCARRRLYLRLPIHIAFS
jgi:hypothetical protein